MNSRAPVNTWGIAHAGAMALRAVGMVQALAMVSAAGGTVHLQVDVHPSRARVRARVKGRATAAAVQVGRGKVRLSPIGHTGIGNPRSIPVCKPVPG